MSAPWSEQPSNISTMVYMYLTSLTFLVHVLDYPKYYLVYKEVNEIPQYVHNFRKLQRLCVRKLGTLLPNEKI